MRDLDNDTKQRIGYFRWWTAIILYLQGNGPSPGGREPSKDSVEEMRRISFDEYIGGLK